MKKLLKVFILVMLAISYCMVIQIQMGLSHHNQSLQTRISSTTAEHRHGL